MEKEMKYPTGNDALDKAYMLVISWHGTPTTFPSFKKTVEEARKMKDGDVHSNADYACWKRIDTFLREYDAHVKGNCALV